MRSHELAKLLLEKPDVELILQEDPEGNGYRGLIGIDFDVVWDECQEIVLSTEWSAEEADMEEDEWEELKAQQSGKIAVLYP